MQRSLISILAIFCLTANVQARDPHETARVETLARSTNSWDGARLPAYPAGQPEITVLRIQIPPGTALPLHRHPVINAGVMLRGKLTVVTEAGKEHHLQAGDAIIELVETWHAGRNEGNEVAEIVVFYAGSTGQAITESKPD
jgi:quercetin dioxygenase-like cupin family protein